MADITFMSTAAGFLFRAIVLDTWSCRVVNWPMMTNLRTRRVLDVLDMATATRRAANVVHHSDRGSQYTLIAFGIWYREPGERPSTRSSEGWPERSGIKFPPPDGRLRPAAH